MLKYSAGQPKHSAVPEAAVLGRGWAGGIPGKPAGIAGRDRTPESRTHPAHP